MTDTDDLGLDGETVYGEYLEPGGAHSSFKAWQPSFERRPDHHAFVGTLLALAREHLHETRAKALLAQFSGYRRRR